MKYWMIVRCNNKLTLSLTQRMVSHGIRAWSPSEVKRYRKPRSRKVIERKFPMLPGLIFVQEADWDMIEMLQRIHIFREVRAMTIGGEFCRVRDGQLDPLRQIEHELRYFEVGDICEIVNSIFEGFCTVVALVGKHYLKVRLNNSNTELKISTSLLRKVHA